MQEILYDYEHKEEDCWNETVLWNEPAGGFERGSPGIEQTGIDYAVFQC